MLCMSRLPSHPRLCGDCGVLLSARRLSRHSSRWGLTVNRVSGRGRRTSCRPLRKLSSSSPRDLKTVSKLGMRIDYASYIYTMQVAHRYCYNIVFCLAIRSPVLAFLVCLRCFIVCWQHPVLTFSFRLATRNVVGGRRTCSYLDAKT